jgi:RNA polymerase sigma-70 factor (ECF subfamily)
VDIQPLFEEHYDVLFRYLVRLTGDPDLAADAAQEAFVRLVERRPEQSQVRGWLFRVATNVVRDDSRVRRRRVELLREAPDRVPVADAPLDPEGMLEARERRARVRAALDSLSKKDQTVLLMREEGFSHQEIAEAVGTTTKSVGSMIARALQKLATELQQRTEVEE